jgi:hypothetical protein
MGKKFFALLVGIDTYLGDVSNLRGCVNDVNHIKDYLQEHVDLDRCIETLTNSGATRENIIRLFREHLGKAGENDVVLFHYSGHGSRELAAPEFREYFSEGKGETLVCYDSRIEGGYDLADKELAVLIREVAKNNPHIVVSLDCCHSGSGLRDAEANECDLGEFREIGGRFEEKGTDTPRPLESYLEDFYKHMDRIRIPQSRHVLMAACDRTQKAWETKDHRGVFSTTLLEVLTKSGIDISYADLYIRCRAAILKRARNQTPQFETCAHFMPYTKFLDGQPLEQRARYYVYFERGHWKMDCGALHGLPAEVEKEVEVALYPESTGNSAADKIAGYAKATSIGAQKSTLLPDFDSGDKSRYYAEIISLPVPPMPVLLEGDNQGKILVKNALPQGANFSFTDEPGIAKYVLSVRNGRFLLSRKDKDTDVLIRGAEGDPQQCCDYIFAVLERVARWERGLVLQNNKTALNRDHVDFKFIKVMDHGREQECHQEDQKDFIKLDFVDGGKVIRARLRARNRAAQKLHVTLVYFSREFGIHILYNEPLVPGKGFVTLWGEGEEDYIGLPEDIDVAMDRFKLIVGTERVDDFLLIQEELELGKIRSAGDPRERDIGTVKEPERERKRKITNDWFTKTITVKTVRQVNRVFDNNQK